jgi:hypothetical protein
VVELDSFLFEEDGSTIPCRDASDLPARLGMKICLNNLASDALAARKAVDSIKCEDVCNNAFCTRLKGVLVPLQTEHVMALTASSIFTARRWFYNCKRVDQHKLYRYTS